MRHARARRARAKKTGASMARACAARFAAVKRQIARSTASLRGVFKRCATAWLNARVAVSARRITPR
eukprot:9354581-Lingulodinium_polyedra.AAC.1